VPHPEKVLLEGAEEAFNTAVAFGLADKGRRGLHAEKADLALEVVAHELGAVVMAPLHAEGDAFGEAAELFAHGLSHRL
jgi:hypothetical protein